MKNEKYKKNCPQCGKDMFYSSMDSLSHCKNTKCNYCANVIRGKSSNRKGCHHRDESKQLISLSKIGIKESEVICLKKSESQKKRYSNIEERNNTSNVVKLAMHRPDVRKKHLDALHHSRWIKVKTDKGQLELLNKWNRLGFNFEPNYQLKTNEDLFYVDGYDKEKNVVLEYDSKYHKKLGQKNKDLIRQQKIINILNPNKFWRYNPDNKQFKDILKG
jgi:hypothetical protein